MMRLRTIVAVLAVLSTPAVFGATSATDYPLVCPAMSLTGASDGAVWFSCDDSSRRLGRVTPTGAIIYVQMPDDAAPACCINGVLAAGDHGEMWYASFAGGIYRISPIGSVQLVAHTKPALAIARGADSNFWVAEVDDNAIARVTPNGVVTQFPLNQPVNPGTLRLGPDGAIWFYGDMAPTQLGKITTAGSVSYIPLPAHTSGFLLVNGGDGYMYVAGRILTGAGGCRVYDHSFKIAPDGSATDIGWFSAEAYGIDGNLWSTLPCEVTRYPNALPSHYDIDQNYAHFSVAAAGDSLWYSQTWLGGYPAPPLPFRITRFSPSGAPATITDVPALGTWALLLLVATFGAFGALRLRG